MMHFSNRDECVLDFVFWDECSLTDMGSKTEFMQVVFLFFFTKRIGLFCCDLYKKFLINIQRINNKELRSIALILYL